MSRKNQREQIGTQLREYLRIAELHVPDQYPLDIKSVAAKLGISRTTLYHYGFDTDINVARERQQANVQLTGKALERRSYEDLMATVRQELAQAQERNKALVARLNLVEGNAMRLGVDPEELYKPIAKPIRSTSRAGTTRSSNNWKRR